MLVICDPRILNKGYGKVVRDSLPDFYCTRREEKALEFFLNPERFRERSLPRLSVADELRNRLDVECAREEVHGREASRCASRAR